MVPVLRLLINMPSNTPLSQPAALKLVGANSLHQEAYELPASQSDGAKGAHHHLVVLGGSASSHNSMGFLVLPGYERIYRSQPVTSLHGATTIESFLQNARLRQPLPSSILVPSRMTRRMS